MSTEDFVLAIQTPLQREVFKSCAQNGVVCIDATHKTNGYDFPLISVVVIDEFGEGFPAAWCISNREDKTVLDTPFAPPLFCNYPSKDTPGAAPLLLMQSRVTCVPGYRMGM